MNKTSNTVLDTIPNAKVGQIANLVDALVILGNTCDKDGIAHSMGISPKSIPSSLRAAEVLGFISIDGCNVEITDLGIKFNQADDDGKSKIFGEQLKNLEPFATIVRAIERGPLTKETIINLVKAKMPKARSWKNSSEEEMFRTIRGWCEFGKMMKEEENGEYTVV